MRECPHCGKQISEGNNTIYCPNCNQIVDEEVLLRMRIEKKLQKSDDQPFRGGKITKEETEKQKRRYNDDDYRSVKVQNNEKSHTSTIISIIVLIVVIAAVYFLLK